MMVLFSVQSFGPGLVSSLDTSSPPLLSGLSPVTQIQNGGLGSSSPSPLLDPNQDRFSSPSLREDRGDLGR